MLLREFDPDEHTLVCPEKIIRRDEDIPERAAACFSKIITERVAEDAGAGLYGFMGTPESGRDIYSAGEGTARCALFTLPVGASACVAALEEMFCRGIRKMVIFGACGVMEKDVGECEIIIPTRAARDEGTSFHYAPPSSVIDVNPRHIDEFEELLSERGLRHREGMSWTTDAIFRETLEKMKRRKALGCTCVDMECSAIAAASSFRGMDIFQFFYAADVLGDGAWDTRCLSNHDLMEEKAGIGALALEMARRMK